MIAPRNPADDWMGRVADPSLRSPMDEITRALVARAQHEGRSRLAPPEGVGDESVTPRRVFWLRVLFALDVIGAGAPGAWLLFSSSTAVDWLFGGHGEPDTAISMLGCIWLGMGVLAVAGLLRPVTMSPLLLVQLLYKGFWLALVAAPSLARGEAVSFVIAGVFLAWAVAVAIALPWRRLFANEVALRNGLGSRDSARSRSASS